MCGTFKSDEIAFFYVGTVLALLGQHFPPTTVLPSLIPRLVITPKDYYYFDKYWASLRVHRARFLPCSAFLHSVLKK